MPNQKSNKGKRNKRTNSSGDEQENGASASAVPGGTASVLTGATAGPPSDNISGKNVTSVNVLPNGTFLRTCARKRYLPFNVLSLAATCFVRVSSPSELLRHCLEISAFSLIVLHKVVA